MSLEGVLSDFGVGEIFQLIGQQRKTGLLEIRSGDAAVEVGFVSGQVLRARPIDSRPDGALGQLLVRTGTLSEVQLCDAQREQEETLDALPEVLLRQESTSKEELDAVGRLMTDETIFELFLWDEGRFRFRPSDELDEGPGDCLRGAEGVLLDALRMKDEWSQIGSSLPDLSGRPVLRASAEAVAEQLPDLAARLSVPASSLGRIADSIDGRASLRSVIDRSRVGSFEGGRAIVAMIQSGLVQVDVRAEPAPAQAAPSAGGDRLQAWIGLAPVLGLPLAVYLLLWPGPRPDTLPLGSSPIAAPSRHAELERLRAALESHRWLEGGYPDRLEALLPHASGLVDAESLSRYVYARRSSGGYALSLAAGAPGQPEGVSPRPDPEPRRDSTDRATDDSSDGVESSETDSSGTAP